MNRTDAIDVILARRAARAEELRVLDEVATRLEVALSDLDQAQLALRTKVDDSAVTILEQVESDIDVLLRRAAAVRRDIGRTGSRFRRKNITIGAVGRSGQGKSTFLQSLTGLGDQEIPAARGGFMTGAPSVIRHVNGPTTAEVEFHDEESFLRDVVGPYYDELNLGPRPTSLTQFGREPLPGLPETTTNRAKQAYDHLRSYRDHLPEYLDHLIGRQRVKAISPSEIITFVAQHDAAGTATHDFRAVRRVRIAANFPAGGLDKVSVIDLPGLGDTNLHDAHVLRQALDGEVDVVLFVRRPDQLREDVHDFDVDLYDVARNALPELAIERWSFFMLNRLSPADGDNSEGVEQFALALNRSRMRVVDVAVANCAVPAEVASAFDQVVEHAVRIVDDLDRILIERRRKDVNDLFAEVDVMIAGARRIAGRAVPSGSWFPRFQTLFNELYAQLAVALDEFVEDMRDRTTETQSEIGTAVQAAVDRAKAEITPPTATELKTMRAVVGSWSGTFGRFLDELRASISRHFLSLDDALKECVDTLHHEVAEVFRTAGRLGETAPGDGRAFLEEFAARVPGDGSAAEIEYGLRFLTEFTLNYRGMIQHHIRRVLEKLNPDSYPLDGDSDAATRVTYMLTELLEETLYEIDLELRNLAHEPQEAVFAVAEEFRDRVLRSRGAQDQWRTVYELLRGEVWSDEFEALAANTALLNQWNRAIDAVTAATKSTVTPESVS